MQIKVKETKTHKIYNWHCTHTLCCKNEDKCVRDDCKSEGKWVNAIIAEAKLVLVKLDKRTDEYRHWLKSFKITKEDGDLYKPILISETEKPKDGDQILLKGQIQKAGRDGVKNWEEASTYYKWPCFKTLALPEHFSPQQLQMIVDGKLKDGDKVLVECIDLCDYEGEEIWEITPNKVIKLNSSNHITLYPIEEKKYTIKEIIDELKYGLSKYGCKREISSKWVLEDNIYFILNGLNKT